ncbi:hypothetical protein [Mangrovicoccus sp. HB161399]|uniref:hypothetical protein n=1 Tax=Mangrovicoccus sp. HB161399 TaxID=2720392 RepID=UPI001552D665|nr:hypothetical protein [Mangrovicoccus sp. HB161399]
MRLDLAGLWEAHDEDTVRLDQVAQSGLDGGGQDVVEPSLFIGGTGGRASMAQGIGHGPETAQGQVGRVALDDLPVAVGLAPEQLDPRRVGISCQIAG